MCVFPLSSTPGSLPRWGSACQAGRGCDDENDNVDACDDNVDANDDNNDAGDDNVDIVEGHEE